jgi:acetyl-CoA carboxylase carboxyl transferase subunit beta
LNLILISRWPAIVNMDFSFFKKPWFGSDKGDPAVTPPDQASTETSFVKVPKLPTSSPRKNNIPKGMWVKCPKCSRLVYDKDLDENQKVCPGCEHHFPFDAWARILSIVDPDSFQEMNSQLTSKDPLDFKAVDSYKNKLRQNRKKTGMLDAVVTGVGKINKHKVALGVMDFRFLGGSMGSVVGEKLTRIIEHATNKKMPVIIFSSSGGARMYEGMLSLMQMAKTCGALAYHAQKKLPYISILTNPTMAGVMASYATVGDLILAEPEATIGFAGRRVIKDTTQAELPPGFQTSEFLIERGLIDSIVPRKDMRGRLTYYLDFMVGKPR